MLISRQDVPEFRPSSSQIAIKTPLRGGASEKAPGKLSESLKNLVQQALIQPHEKSDASLSTTSLNLDYSWQVAQIGALFEAIYHQGCVSNKDFEKMDQMRHTLDGLGDRIQQLPLTSEQKAEAIAKLGEAHRLLADTGCLARTLHDYSAKTPEFDEAEASLVDSTYEPYEIGAPLMALGQIEKGISGLADLWETAQPNEGSPIVSEKMLDLFETDMRNFSFVVEDWAETAGSAMKEEHRLLEKLLEKTEDPAEKKNIQAQLQALNTQIKEVQGDLKNISHTLKDLQKSFQGHPKLLEHVKTMQEAVSDTLQATIKEHVAVKNLEPSVRYGSDEWKLLVEDRPGPVSLQDRLVQQIGPLEKKNAATQWVARGALAGLNMVHNVTHPETWSDTTKSLIHGVFVGMQLSQQAINVWNTMGSMKGRAITMQREVLEAVPKEQANKINDETSILGNLLTSKFNEMKSSDKTFEHLTKRYPTIRTALRTALDSNEALSQKQIGAITDAYRLQKLVEASPISSPFSHLSFNQWWNLFTDEEAHSVVTAKVEPLTLAASETPKETATKSDGIVSKCLSWIGSFWSTAQAPVLNNPPADFFETKTQETKQELKQALSSSVKLERTLTAHPELEELRAESTRLHCALLSTARQAPESTGSLPELASWCQEVEDQCYAIEALEQHISLLMDKSRSVLNMDDTELLKYGHKHANNVKQARIAQALNIPGVVVPLPHGINSETVQRFLKTQAPEIFEHWSALGELYQQNKESSPFLEQPKAKAHLEAIEKSIERSFNMPGAFDALDLPAELISWLDEVKASGNYLMVRSTGKGEDTRQTANAGGNVSKAYVSPDHESFCQAAGDVISSYFGYASLQNRINAGLNPLPKNLVLPLPLNNSLESLLMVPVNPTRYPFHWYSSLMNPSTAVASPFASCALVPPTAMVKVLLETWVSPAILLRY